MHLISALLQSGVLETSIGRTKNSTVHTVKAHSFVLTVFVVSLNVRPFFICVFVCADDCPGGASVWSAAAGALWRSGGESGDSPAQKWSAESTNHHS